MEMYTFIPQLNSDKFFLEIKISIRKSRTTIPESYENFAKSVINEFFTFDEVV